jgi:hypothetical protein
MCCGLRPFDAALSLGIAYRARIPEIFRACLVALTFLFGLLLPFFGSFSTATACAALAAGVFAYSRLSKKEVEKKKKARRGLCHDRWSAGKVPDSVDAIVIGSGMGGLTAAAILARAGKRVLVVEQHDVAGGGTHTFPLGPQGAYQFDSGLHYTYDRGTRTLSLVLVASFSFSLSIPLFCLGDYVDQKLRHRPEEFQRQLSLPYQSAGA